MKPVYRKFVVIPGILVAAVVIAISLTRVLEGEAPKRDREQLDLLVEVMPIEVLTERFEVRSQGTVQPLTRTIISAEVSGVIVDISPKFVAGGIFVPREVLLRIDPTNYEVAVDKAEALVKQRQIEYDGAVKLRERGYRAESELASAAAALASAQAELVSARRNLERTLIRVPYAGMVISKDADLGQFVTPGTRLGVTFATDVAEVRLPLTDQDLALLDLPKATDLRSTAVAAGPPVKLAATRKGKDMVWQGRIVRTEGVVDERSRVTYAVARVEDPYGLEGAGPELPVGTFVTANIAGRTVEGVMRIPRTALRGSDQVLVVDEDDRIRLRTVEIIHSDQQYAYLIGGVTPGERITTTTIEAPVNGMSVRTAEADEDELAEVSDVKPQDAAAGDDFEESS